MEKLKEIFMYALGAIITLGFFGSIWILISHVIPEANKDTLNQVIGGLLVAWSMVVSYFFGSSKGSSDKNKFLEHNDK